MHTVDIELRPRYLSGSDVARKVRRAGLLPAVVYHKGQDAKSVAVDPKVLRRGLQGAYGHNQIFQITLGDETSLAIAREFQLHPVQRTLQHVDFLIVQADTPIEVTVPLRTHGRSAGQKAGGRLEVISREVAVRCTPETLPTHIEIDVTPLKGGATLAVEDLVYPTGVEPIFRRSFKVLGVTMPKSGEETAV